MNKWTNKRTNKQTNEQTNKRTNEQTNTRMNKWILEHTNEQTNKRTIEMQLFVNSKKKSMRWTLWNSLQYNAMPYFCIEIVLKQVTTLWLYVRMTQKRWYRTSELFVLDMKLLIFMIILKLFNKIILSEMYRILVCKISVYIYANKTFSSSVWRTSVDDLEWDRLNLHILYF